ncbi:ABC-type Fe3+ transport system domain protein [Metarhizium robertsii]|uniref:ABC-type Fe3+ transport system n=2 Tax=Metarhizium robertsii TaxID=568076 RepID=E9F7F5_METRA|nr:ABC-type Fe3+ transport system [Metarhizium robertsii ARSEF 23]EFY96292.1 ABC-type Fe3+ transport system [Metarhizium robertsii ARSEF 23]EXU98567.1 ABC-type Fe3+ transport system domain protein [Metarhizium robertsii]
MRPVLASSFLLSSALAACVDGAGKAGGAGSGAGAQSAVESRTIEQIYEAAVAEGGEVVLWHGGDEKNQMDFIKDAFEKRFPKMNLTVTVDLSKYHDGRIDQQVAAKAPSQVDSVYLQTVHDFPRWAKEGVLLDYAPLGYDQILPGFKDKSTASWYALEVLFWQNAWNTKKLPNANFNNFDEFLKPEYKDKLVLTYPNDDDAVLFAFDLILQKKGNDWLDKLLAQNPTWVRGTATPFTLIAKEDSPLAATFTTAVGFANVTNIRTAFPNDANFVSWGQRGGILKNAPHPEGAKLLAAFMLTPEFQKEYGWSVRGDVPAPAGFPKVTEMQNTDVFAFNSWMEDRARVERLRFWYEDRIGTAQGVSPLVDNV